MNHDLGLLHAHAMGVTSRATPGSRHLLTFGHMLAVSGMPHWIIPSSPQKGIAFWLSA